ncbi:MAG: transposase [Ilumatobacteraceae bacterium]|nr:transposase [Ilumatobacteraceae bacterium]
MTALVQQELRTGLEVEMTDHLGYERHAADGRNTGNSRNGSYPKTVTTEVGKVRLDVSRDRNASFEPATIPKGQRRLDGFSGNVISLYAKGMTTGDILAHLAEIYDTDISPGHDQPDHRRRLRRHAAGSTDHSTACVPPRSVIGSCRYACL